MFSFGRRYGRIGFGRRPSLLGFLRWVARTDDLIVFYPLDDSAGAASARDIGPAGDPGDITSTTLGQGAIIGGLKGSGTNTGGQTVNNTEANLTSPSDRSFTLSVAIDHTSDALWGASVDVMFDCGNPREGFGVSSTTQELAVLDANAAAWRNSATKPASWGVMLYHVAFRENGGAPECDFYLFGLLCGTITGLTMVSAPAMGSTGRFNEGASSGGGANPIGGEHQIAGMWGRAFTAEDVAEYLRRLTGLRHWYTRHVDRAGLPVPAFHHPFVEQGDVQALDLGTGNENHGAWNASPIWAQTPIGDGELYSVDPNGQHLDLHTEDISTTEWAFYCRILTGTGTGDVYYTQHIDANNIIELQRNALGPLRLAMVLGGVTHNLDGPAIDDDTAYDICIKSDYATDQMKMWVNGTEYSVGIGADRLSGIPITHRICADSAGANVMDGRIAVPTFWFNTVPSDTEAQGLT